MFLSQLYRNIFPRKELKAFSHMLNTRDLRKRLKNVQPQLEPGQAYEDWVELLLSQDQITQQEADSLIQTRLLVEAVIHVDDFPPK